MNQLLNTTSSMIKVYKAVFSMDGSKSPRPDGMSPLFYRKYDTLYARMCTVQWMASSRMLDSM